MKTAIYPGTFDPITYGHIDVIKKSLNIFDRVIVATTDNINKNYHFSIDDRIDIINNSSIENTLFTPTPLGNSCCLDKVDMENYYLKGNEKDLKGLKKNKSEKLRI